MRKWTFVTILLFPLFAYSLVDYSEDSVSYSSAAVKRSAPVKKRLQKPTISRHRLSRSTTGGYTPSGVIKIKLDHNVQSLTGEFSGKFSQTKIRTHIQTPYNIFLDASYWMANFDNYQFVQTSELQAGNAQVKLGFNWLRWGDAADMSTIDLYLGTRFRGGESDLSIVRNDKFVGVETAKRFLNFAVGFGYEYTVHSKTDSLLETSLKKTHKIASALSWQSTGDIRFVVEADFFTVEAEQATYRFSSITPKLDLALSPLFNLELGGIFAMKRATMDRDFLQARLWDLAGAYGNSIFANLKLNL